MKRPWWKVGDVEVVPEMVGVVGVLGVAHAVVDLRARSCEVHPYPYHRSEHQDRSTVEVHHLEFDHGLPVAIGCNVVAFAAAVALRRDGDAGESIVALSVLLVHV